jgi:hypothetical protein
VLFLLFSLAAEDVLGDTRPCYSDSDVSSTSIAR